MAVVTWTGSTDTDYGTAGNWDTGSVPTSSDDVIIADVTNNCVLDGSRSVNSFTVLSGGDFNGNTEMLTVVGEADGSGATSNGFAVNIDGVIVGTTTDITVTTPTATTVDFYAQGGGKVRHVTINHASCVATLGALLDISGDLTITAGELNTNSGSNYAVTVTGACEVTGTLTCNDSAVTLGSLEVVSGATFNAPSDSGSGLLTIGNVTQSTAAGVRGFYVSDGATFAHNSGTIKFTGTQGISPCHGGTATYNNVTFAQSGTIEYKDTRTGSDNWIIVGTLTINAGATLTNQNEADRINCTGDCSVSGVLDLNHASGGDHNFGSLTIASGGTYSATSGTTTITGETASHAWNNTGGTFTHNNGKVKIYDATGTVMGSTSVRENTFYDLEISLHVATYTCSLYDVSGNAVTILNNLDVTKGEVEFSTASDTITIHGLTNISSNAEFNDNVGHDTNKIIHNGLVTNKGTYNISDGTTVKMNGGIRNLGTITVK